MGDITNLSWQIIIPDDSDWLVVNPMSGTGNTKINVDIVDSRTGSTTTAATISAVCTSCSEYLEPFTLEIIRCIMCDCDDLVVERIFPCGCEDLEIELLDLCDCEDLTLAPKCNCSNIIISDSDKTLEYEAAGGTKSITITKECDITYSAEPNPSTYIHTAATATGISITVDPNTSTSPRNNGTVLIKYKNNTCHTISVLQKGKDCECGELNLRCKTNCD